jgi:hypothetical protein
MGKVKQILNAGKLVFGIGSKKLPTDWPVNGFKEALKKAGGFKDSFMSSATGRENKAATLFINSKIVDARDQQIWKYLRDKGITL